MAYDLINTDTDELCGEFADLTAARKQVRKLRLRAYEIWRHETLDGDRTETRRVEFCNRHPDDVETPEDTPSLDDHPFSPASVRFELGE